MAPSTSGTTGDRATLPEGNPQGRDGASTAPLKVGGTERGESPAGRSRGRRRRLAYVAVALAVVAAAAYFLTPVVRTALDTVSTDDAYVNGHFTAVAPRVDG